MSKEQFEVMRNAMSEPTPHIYQDKSTTNIWKKIFQIKKEIQPLTKDTTNDFYNSKYFDINALLNNIEPILSKYNLMLLQPIKEGKLVTILIDVDSSEEYSSSIDLPTNVEPQKMGSAITYYRRYSIVSMLGLQAEDDDANATTKQPTQKKDKKWLNLTTKEGEPLPLFNKLVERIKNGDKLTLSQFENEYKLSQQVKNKLIEIGIK